MATFAHITAVAFRQFMRKHAKCTMKPQRALLYYPGHSPLFLSVNASPPRFATWANEFHNERITRDMKSDRKHTRPHQPVNTLALNKHIHTHKRRSLYVDNGCLELYIVCGPSSRRRQRRRHKTLSLAFCGVDRIRLRQPPPMFLVPTTILFVCRVSSRTTFGVRVYLCELFWRRFFRMRVCLSVRVICTLPLHRPSAWLLCMLLLLLLCTRARSSISSVCVYV